ncbi:conserved hypothetical protein [Coccidioides posadasii str. Silveira]|uniref:PhoD-like phosphatase domain-containing protein n=2 Tax=Coccidioides posadasii TaxID=199306 RepID=E9DHD7_COCPS|nr:conserved hypothetical protein [Coccidioides posadasii str. Silveira]KMM65904.1 hypothetical protein CPAG_02245 [Coccidioides posadasii RMSCC 3488]
MSSAQRQATTTRSRSASNTQIPANGKFYTKSTQPPFDSEYDDQCALPSTREAPIIRGNSFRRSHGPEQSTRVGVRSFAERARNLPPERRLPEPPRSSPTETVHGTTSIGTSPANPNSRSSSVQNTASSIYQSPPAPRSIPQSQPSEPPSPVAQSNPDAVPKKDDKRRRDRDWAPARSPLQKLEVTLKDISKEEKRARVEEAEMLLREAKAGRQNRRISQDVRPSPRLKENSHTTETMSQQPPTLEEAGLTRSLSTKQRERLQQSAVIESTKPSPGRFSTDREGFDYQPLESEGLREPMASEMVNQVRARPDQDPEFSLDGGAYQFMAAANDDESTPQQRVAQPSVNQFKSRGYAEDRRSWQHPHANPPSFTPAAPVQRSNSRKLQKPILRELREQPATEYPANTSPAFNASRTKPYDQARALSSPDPKDQPSHINKPVDGLRATNDDPVGQGYANASNEAQSDDLDSITGLKKSENKQKRVSVTFAVPPPTPPPLDEWRNATVGFLLRDDFKFQSLDGKAWWEGKDPERRKRNQSVSQNIPRPSPKIKKNTPFEPPLYLKCGPLLRFTGIKRERIDSRTGPAEREIWRGSIMIATKDSASSYDIPPTLRIFSQPRDLLPPPPTEIRPEHGELAPEYVDPIAGLTKLSRNGKLLYVKPVDHVEEAKDLCFVENEDGLFEESPSPLDYSTSNRVGKSPDARVGDLDGESVGRYKEIPGFRLYADSARDVTFWRFNIQIELGSKQEHIAYRINQGSAQGFWVPAKGQMMNIMFHSGNCFGASVDTDKFSGPDPLWRDALNVHQTRPFHVMIGGGSQIYNDAVAFETEHFQNWLDIKVKYEKYQHPFNLDIKAELEEFYLDNYLRWFSQGLFSMASAQIPMVNMWDDHDIISGFGSYSDELMTSPVFSGLGNIAFKYYMLFQHQSVPEETQLNEPSWIMGPAPGPFIEQKSRSIFVHLGRRAALLAVDCRTERTRYDILSDDTYDLIWNRCHEEIIKGETKHLLVLISIPVAYPRMAWLENVTSKVMDPVRSLSKVGLFGSSETKVGSGAEHLDDHWTAKLHKLERRWLIEDLQELAAEKSVRITILGGDANLAAMGQFYTDPKLEIPKDQDYRYMPNVVSSPIVNAPLPQMMSDALNRRNKVHAVDTKTMEDMRPIFTHDVDGKPRNNKRLLPRRNWCCIREYAPGSTPIDTPSEPSTPEPPRVGNLARSLSLSRGEGRGLGRSFSLSRRFSARGPPPSRYEPAEYTQRSMSYDGSQPLEARDSPSQQGQAHPSQQADGREPEPGDFIRRRTDLSAKQIKQALKRGNDTHHFINLEGGLDITLNCEVSPSDPAGITTPYRVLVPALSFNGEFEPSIPLQKRRWWMLRRKKPETTQHEDNSDGEYDYHTNQGAERPYTPPAQEKQGQFSSPEGVGQGYGGVEAYRPKKKRFGIF